MKATVALIAAVLATSPPLYGQALTTPDTTSADREPFLLKTADSTDGNSTMATQAQTNALKLPPPGNPLWSVPLSKLSQTRQRPLFTPSRRPPPPATASADIVLPRKPEKQITPPLALVGTIVGAGEGFGVFIDDTAKTLVRLKTGSEYHGWLLRSVTSREVVLKKDDLSVTLSLPRHNL